MQLSPGQWAVFIIAGILILGFILGYYSNRQRAEKTLIWLREGLSTLGKVTIGSKLPGMVTGGRLEVNQAGAPLKNVEVVYLLAPRDNLIFWFFHVLQGRGDELIVWINFQSKPEQSVEVARKSDRQFGKRLTDMDKPALSIIDEVNGLQVAVEDKPGVGQAAKVQTFLANHPSSIIRLALRPEKPNLYLRANLRRLQSASPADFFAACKDLGG